MKNFKLTKSSNEKRRALAFLAALVVLGTAGVEEEAQAIDLRNREKNIIKIEDKYTKLKKSEDKIDVINICTPNADGISHNIFKDFSVGTGNGVIFNNSTKDGISQIGGKVKENLNLSGTSAKVILNEVIGKTPSNINGEIEVFGDKADFILANENGIMVNGAKFINTNGVTLTTGKVAINDSKFGFYIQNGKIILNGVENNQDYFNVYAQTIEIQKEISLGENSKDITMITGENTLEANSRNLGEVSIVSSKNPAEKYSVSGTELGAMYGKNIKFISTDLGLGVKHDGLIFNSKDIKIDSNGDITNSGENAAVKTHDTVSKKLAGKVDIINIKTPNKQGISHNKFTDLNVKAGNGIIFNNSSEDGKSVIGGDVSKNPNLKGISAKAILSEVTGKTPSNIDGTIEVFGNKADFILANENGIKLNNASFINTNGVTLTTGKVSLKEGNFNFDVQHGKILLDNVDSDGSYFDVYAKYIEIEQKILPSEKGKESDITMIAGVNNLKGNIANPKEVKIVSSKKDKTGEFGIYGSDLGAVYGKNIKLVSTDLGFGVRHDGLILSSEDVKIDSSNGTIILKDVETQGNLEITGKNVVLEKKDKNLGEKGNISAGKDIRIESPHNIINKGKISGNGNIDISGKNIFNNENSSILAEKDLILTAKETIVNKTGSIVEANGKKDLNAPEVK